MRKAARIGPDESRPRRKRWLGVEEAAGLTARFPVTADVPALGTEDDDRDRFIGLVAKLPVGGRVNADHAAGLNRD